MEIRIIDYSSGKKAHVLKAIMKEYNAIVNDWAEKDYGLLLFIEVDADRASAFERRVNSLDDFGLDTADYIG